MVVRVVLIWLLEIDRGDFIHKGVSFAPNNKRHRKLNNVVLIDANSLTIGVFSFGVKLFRCRSPPKFKFKQKNLNGGKKDGRKP